jgi:hypothetical protein
MPFPSAISLRKYVVYHLLNCIIKMGKYFVLQIASLHVKWSSFAVGIRCCQTNPMGIRHILVQLDNGSHVACTRITYKLNQTTHTPTHTHTHTRFNKVRLDVYLLGYNAM